MLQQLVFSVKTRRYPSLDPTFPSSGLVPVRPRDEREGRGDERENVCLKINAHLFVNAVLIRFYRSVV
jgi:hypothetical protein